MRPTGVLGTRRWGFSLFVLFSLAAHGAVILTHGVLGHFYTKPVFAVQQALTSMDIEIIHEFEESSPFIEETEIIMSLPDPSLEPAPVVEIPVVAEPVVDEKPKNEPEDVPVEILEGALTEAKPEYLLNPAPRYPREARRRGWEGLVVLEVVVSRAGRPLQLSIERSSGHDILDMAALNAVREWKFRSAQLGGIAIESSVRVPVRFQLEQK